MVRVYQGELVRDFPRIGMPVIAVHIIVWSLSHKESMKVCLCWARNKLIRDSGLLASDHSSLIHWGLVVLFW